MPPTNYAQQYGPGSEFASKIFMTIDNERDAQLASILESLRMEPVMQLTNPANAEYDPTARTAVVQGQVNKALTSGQGLSEEDEDLMAAAKFWGIPPETARNMPKAALQEAITQYRNEARPTEVGVIQGASAMLGMFGTGAGKALMGMLESTPLLPDTWKRALRVEDAEMWFKGLEEGVRANLTEKDQFGASIVSGAGALVGLWYPGIGAYKLAGMAGKLIPGGAALMGRLGVLAPIARGAMGGAATGWMLEGEGEHARMAILGGAALGGVLEPAVLLAAHYSPVMKAAIGRVTNAFRGPQDELQYAVNSLKDLGGDLGAMPAAMDGVPVQEVDIAGALGRAKAVADDVNLPPEVRINAKAMIEALEAQNMAKPIRVLGTEQADAAASQLTKRDMVLGAPDMPERVVATVIDDATAAGAAVKSNPGGLLVVPGVKPDVIVDNLGDLANSGFFEAPATGVVMPQGEAGSLRTVEAVRKAQSLVGREEFAARVQAEIGRRGSAEPLAEAAATEQVARQIVSEGIPSFRFASRRGSYKVDMLVSDGAPITDKMVSQYERHGMMAGQNVLTSRGKQGKLIDILDDGTAIVQPAYAGKIPPYKVRASSLQPMAMSERVEEATGMYDGFKAYVEQRMRIATAEMGGAEMPGWLEEATTQRMSGFLEDFFTENRILRPSDRASLRSYFNIRRVEEFQNLNPEVDAIAQHISAEAERITSQAEVPVIQDLRARLMSRGYNLVSNVGRPGYTAVPATRQAAGVPLKDEAAIERFTQTVNEDMPDLTPASAVPVEVAQEIPTSSHLNPVIDGDVLGDKLVEGVVQMEQADVMDNIQQAAAQANASYTAEGAALAEIAEPGPNEALRASIQRFKHDKNYGRIMTEYSNGVNRRLRAMNSRMKLLEGRLTEAGFDVARPWKTYQELSNAVDIKHNWEAEWHDGWSHIMQKFSNKKLRNGSVTRVYEMEDAADRLSEAKRLGFTKEETDALDEMDAFFQRIFPETGIEANRQIKRYISHVRQRQELGLTGEDGYAYDQLSPYTDFFAEHIRGGNVQVREMDARVLGPMYIRSLGFKKFVSEPWEANIALWNQVAKDPDVAPVAQMMLDWAGLLRFGYAPQQDLVVDVVQSALRPFMQISRKEAADIVGVGLSATHNALLGFRPDVLLRDSIQPLLAVPRVGTKVFDVLGDYVGGTAATKQAIWERGMTKGWVQVGKPRIESPGAFERDEIIQATGGIAPAGKGRKVALAFNDAFRDMFGPGLQALKDKGLSPLHLYTKLSERNRLFVGEAGYQHATENIAKFRNNKLSYDQLTSEVVGSYDKPVQRRFKELVDLGLDDEAASLMGNELANVTQFRYGSTESPEGMRSITGRVGMQFGNFSLQFHSFVSESLRNGDVASKAKFLAWMGAVAGSLKLAKAETGWDFDKWQFYNAYTFTGSPWLKTAADITSGMGAVSSEMQGRDLTPDQMRAQENMLTAVGDAAGRLNPLQGIARMGTGVAQAVTSRDPADAFGRMVFTGERGSNRQEEQYFNEYTRSLLMNSVESATPTPMRANSITVPPVPAISPTEAVSQPQGGVPSPRAAAQAAPSRDDLVGAIIGDPQSIMKFSQEELAFIKELEGVPYDERYQAFLAWRGTRVQDARTLPGGTPAGATSGHPGMGAQF